MSLFRNKAFFVFSILSFLFSFHFPVFAENIVVDDEFTSSSDLSHYTIYQNNGTVSINNGDMLLSAPNGNSFPFVILTEELPVNFSIEIRFKYPDRGLFGNGIEFSEEWPYSDPSIEDNRGKFLYYFWGDPDGTNLFKIVNKNPIQQVKLFGTYDYDYHIAKLIKNENHYSFYLDSFLKDDFTDSSRNVRFISFGNSFQAGSDSTWSEIAIDYVRVTDLGETNNFPYLSQKDPQWANLEYDQASQWAPDGHRGIANWGCALTSAAMIFQHFGVKSPTGETTTPLVLNSWLKNQSDGYVGQGFVNWIALTRYAKEAKDAGQSPTSLEFKMSNYDPNQTYDTPSILNLPGHFIVGYDQTQDQFKIKDPADETKTELAKNSPTIRKIDRFIPSNTDLSYFMFTIEPDFEIQLKDQNGQSLGEEFTQEPLVDDMGNGSDDNGQGLKILQVPKPPTGDFTLTVANPKDEGQTYHLTEYWYDHNGQVEKKTENYHLIPHHQDKYHFNYTGSVGETNNQISIDSIREILATYYNQGEMLRFYNHFLNRWLDQVQQANTNQRKQEIMTALKRVVGANTTIITDQARSDILERINQWLSSH